jgi:hypothetical protein
MNTANVCRVYDTGHGAFIYSYMGNTPRYLKNDGTFENPEYRTCNGDPVKWKLHIGEYKELKFSEDLMK